MGDNGDGQSTLRFIAWLLPRAMGLARATADEENLIAFLSPGRDSLRDTPRAIAPQAPAAVG